MMRSFRKNLDIILIVVVAAFGATIFYGYGSRLPTRQGAIAEAAAQINNTPISFQELNSAFQNVIAQYDQATLSSMDENTINFLRRMVLENMIDRELLYQEAQSRNIRISDAQANAQIEELRAHFPSQEEWNRFLQFQNLDMRTLRESFRRELMIQTLSESLGSDITIPEEEVRSYYEENQPGMVVSPRYSLMQITLPTRDEADSILTRVSLGQDFGELAQEYSIDAFAERGGERGWVSESFLPESAREEIIALADHEENITSPIEGSAGFTIYQVTDFQPGEDPSFEEMEDRIRDFLASQQAQVRIDHLLGELRSKADITISELLMPEDEEEPAALPDDLFELDIAEDPDEEPDVIAPEFGEETLDLELTRPEETE